ncbi:MAG TPA: hypothetical protein VFN13_07340 [Rudaea sp.]|nr:hypothetical protein [Rudaea sp.]
MSLRAIIAALFLCAACGQAVAADVIGYSEAFDTLYRVNLATQTATEIGRATPPGIPRLALVEGLTFDPTGKLYAVSDAGAVKTLLSINEGTGLATVIGVLDLGTSDKLDLGMAFTCDGRLWLSAVSGQLWQVNPATAQITLIGTMSSDGKGVSITGLAARGNQLYGAGSQGDNHFYLIDTGTAKASLVGAYASSAYITAASPGFDTNGQLWVLLDYVPPAPGESSTALWSDLGQIAPNSGQLTNLGPVTAQGESVANLAHIGLRGLAIPSSVCAIQADVAPTPTLSRQALAILSLLFALLAGTVLRKCRPTH